MATEFKKVYDKFLFQVRDLEFDLFDDAELEQILYNYLENATVEFKQCRNDLNDFDSELGQFNKDLTVEEIYIISLGMVLHWLRPKINREELLKQSIGDRDYKLASNWQTLGKLMDRELMIQSNLRNYISKYQYIASEIL